MEMVPVRHDSEGMEPADLDMVLKSTGARIVYLTPVGHNPIGFETGEARRRELLSVIERHDAKIVEDDIYSVYATKGAPTFKEMAPGRTYSLNSIDRTSTRLLRLGILAPPPARPSPTRRPLRAEP